MRPLGSSSNISIRYLIKISITISLQKSLRVTPRWRLIVPRAETVSRYNLTGIREETCPEWAATGACFLKEEDQNCQTMAKKKAR